MPRNPSDELWGTPSRNPYRGSRSRQPKRRQSRSLPRDGVRSMCDKFCSLISKERRPKSRPPTHEEIETKMRSSKRSGFYPRRSSRSPPYPSYPKQPYSNVPYNTEFDDNEWSEEEEHTYDIPKSAAPKRQGSLEEPIYENIGPRLRPKQDLVYENIPRKKSPSIRGKPKITLEQRYFNDAPKGSQDIGPIYETLPYDTQAAKLPSSQTYATRPLPDIPPPITAEASITSASDSGVDSEDLSWRNQSDTPTPPPEPQHGAPTASQLIEARNRLRKRERKR